VKAPFHRPAWLEIDLDAVRHNAALLRRVVAPAELLAVVKADAYGHGAVAVARAALAGGATWLAVALVEEGVALREAGVDAPVLLLSEPVPDAMEEAVARDLTLALYSRAGIEAAERACASRGRPAPVHVKLDTGMHRVGAAPEDLLDLVQAVVQSPWLEFEGLWTHFSVADEPDDPFTSEQLTRFAAGREVLAQAGVPAPRYLHTANSAGAIAWPASRFDLVRCGIALYGYPPTPPVAAELDRAVGPEGLRPVLSWKSAVTRVRTLEADARPSYGRLAALGHAGEVATVPVGYHDGVPRAFFTGGGEVLVGGRRMRLAGAVTMDQIVLDCGAEGPPVHVGDEVVLIGTQGDETVTAAEWAAHLGTIVYEVLCGIGPRVPRVGVGGG
jgi:alanine racemase